MKTTNETKRVECPECGSERMRTESGAVLCPNGHGKCKHMHEGHYRRLIRDLRTEKWLASFPVAVKQKRGFEIPDRGGRWKRQKPEGAKTSVVKRRTTPPEGSVVAKVEVNGNFRVYFFAPLKTKSKVTA